MESMGFTKRHMGVIILENSSWLGVNAEWYDFPLCGRDVHAEEIAVVHGGESAVERRI
jgi:hypothetical protein